MTTQIFKLTEKQKELTHVAASGARHVLAVGGGRSGKTFALCRCIAVRALSAPGSRHFIGRQHLVDIRLSVFLDTWPKMTSVAFPGVAYRTNKVDQVVTFENGSEVWFGGLDDEKRIDKILGREFATIYVNESSQVDYATILTLRTRLAQRVNKINGKELSLRMYYDLNPVGTGHWTYKEFIKGVRPDNPDIKIKSGTHAYVFVNPMDNAENLPAATLEELAALPERQRQRFFEGKYQPEVPGTLWPLDRIEACRVESAPEMQRIVVAVDPSGSDGTTGDSQGICVMGRGIDGHGYLLEDATVRVSPAQWAARVVYLYNKYGADCIVAERNFGGEMVRSTIQSADKNAPFKFVNASRGKVQRAEPIAALYETRGDIKPTMHHVGRFPELEEQMAAFTTGGYQGAGSPDRADAMVWAATELMLDTSEPFVWYINGKVIS